MRIGVVGLGLIGTSLALAARRGRPDVFFVGVDRDEVLSHPRIVETFTVRTTDLSALSATDVIVLATPVDAILETLPTLAAVAPAVPVTDTGSTKRVILRVAHESGLRAFVGGHPMAGSDRSGADAARADLFDARPWFLFGSGRARTAVARLVQTLGARPVFMHDDGTEHDRVMAAVSHLPQVVASALMTRIGETVGEDGLALAGAGLRDTTRLAGSEARIWESVLATNDDVLAPLLRALASDLERVAGELRDHAAVRRLFGLANLYRRQL